MLRVLLLSPLAPHDPRNGDSSYTESLLAHPPDDVEYTTYVEALETQDLVEHGRRSSLRRAWGQRDVTGAGRELARTAFLHGCAALRKRHLLSWEPHRFFSVRPGAFDLVHVHVFSVGFLHLPCPLIVSNGASARDLYRVARGYGEERVHLMEGADRILARYHSVNLNSFHLPEADEVWSFSENLRDWYRDIGFDERRLAVVRPFIDPPDEGASWRAGPRVGFVAQAFELKGGLTFLDAWRTVRQARPDVRAVIAGCEPRLSQRESDQLGIDWLGHVARRTLLDEVFPSLDVFAYPSTWDGLPLTPVEALSRGVPVVISDYGALPEIVDHGRAGLVSAVGDADQLASKLLRALDPDVNASLRKHGLEHFRSTFSSDAGRRAHGDGYRRVLQTALSV